MLSSTKTGRGTSLSLQIGHRISDDLDLFSAEPLDMIQIQLLLTEKYGFEPSSITLNTIIGFLNGIKIDVFYHPFPWLDNAVEEDGIRLASLSDITAMKMHAIINSGKRPKDFVDLAFLSMHFSYNEMKNLLLKRYPSYDPIMADKAVIFFDDIEEDLFPEIKMIGYKFDFQAIKNRVVKMTDSSDKVYATAPLQR